MESDKNGFLTIKVGNIENGLEIMNGLLIGKMMEKRLKSMRPVFIKITHEQ